MKKYKPTQLSHKLQCDALGGRNILHVKQYLSFTGCPRTIISFVRGGGLYVGELPLFGTSAEKKKYILKYFKNIL